VVLLLVDLDGVVYRGGAPVPGVPDVLRRRVESGDRVIYVTNNSRWHRSEYRARLANMGAPVTDDGVVSSARATALAIASRDPRPKLVMVFGGPGLAREMTDLGLEVVDPTPEGLAREPDVLAVGIDFDLTHLRLTCAVNAVLRGAWFVATNRDPIYPVEEGLLAGAGSMVAAVSWSAGREPDLIVGKPEPTLFIQAAASVNVPVEDAVVIGDSLVTDIRAANRVRARSVLMLTGVTTEAQASDAAEDARPTAVARDARELEQALERLAAE
jgi:HAD superfamily hydrolase (TIGR01450 family)